MKVLLLNGSPHVHGCTYTALSEVARTLNEEKINTEIIHVAKKEISGCTSCRFCKQAGYCVFDDLVNEVVTKFNESDGVIIGSPVYYASPNGTLISFLDRFFFSNSADKSMKVGGAVVSCRRGGASAAFDVLNKYFTISKMPVVSSQYWNSVHGNDPLEISKDKEGLQIMRTLGKNMAFLLRSIELGKKTLGLPKQETPIYTNFICEKRGE